MLGTHFGGNNTTTLSLPNLDGITIVGAGEASGLGSETIGQKSGSSSVLLNYPQAPPNILGQSQPFDNHQPSLGITYEIETEGVFPSMGGGPPVPFNTLGMIKAFAGTFAPAGYMACNGQLLSIAQNQALFAVLGTTYGGDGQTTSRFRTCAAATSSAPVLRPRSERRSGRQMWKHLVNGQAPTRLAARWRPSRASVIQNFAVQSIRDRKVKASPRRWRIVTVLAGSGGGPAHY